MKLYEYEGKKLFKTYGMAIPEGVVVSKTPQGKEFSYPMALKAQVKSGSRGKAGGVLFASDEMSLQANAKELFGKKFQGEKVKKILIEQKIDIAKEYYVSISYDSDARSPVLALYSQGGVDVQTAMTVPIDIIFGIPDFFAREALRQAGFPGEDSRGLVVVIQKLWQLFITEYALLVEINPLFKAKTGEFIAGDAKIILDDEKINPGERRFIEMDGDIAILASGGGASLLNMDALLLYGGKPANYTEYSGNPKAEAVKELTKRVLKRKGLKGCWVIGGVANFTDIYETLRGFVEGLREVKPKPAYPIVIRRDGPRKKEAFEMLREVGKKEGYDFHLFDGETPMEQTAKTIVSLAYGK